MVFCIFVEFIILLYRAPEVCWTISPSVNNKLIEFRRMAHFYYDIKLNNFIELWKLILGDKIF